MLQRGFVALHGLRGDHRGFIGYLGVALILLAKEVEQVQMLCKRHGGRYEQQNQQTYQYRGKLLFHRGDRAPFLLDDGANAHAPQLIAPQAGKPAVDPLLQRFFIKHRTIPPGFL